MRQELSALPAPGICRSRLPGTRRAAARHPLRFSQYNASYKAYATVTGTPLTDAFKTYYFLKGVDTNDMAIVKNEWQRKETPFDAMVNELRQLRAAKLPAPVFALAPAAQPWPAPAVATLDLQHEVNAFFAARRSGCQRFKVRAKEPRFKKNTGGTSGELNKAEILAALASWDSKIYREEETLKESIYRAARDHEEGLTAAAAAAAAAAATRTGASGGDGASGAGGGDGASGDGGTGAGACGAGTGGTGADTGSAGTGGAGAGGAGAGTGGAGGGAFDPEVYNPGLVAFDHVDGLQAVKTWSDCYLGIEKYTCQQSHELELPSDSRFEAALASSLHGAITVGILNVLSVVLEMRLWKPATVQQTACARAAETNDTAADRCRIAHLLTEPQLHRIIARYGEALGVLRVQHARPRGSAHARKASEGNALGSIGRPGSIGRHRLIKSGK
ncbi:hypothetical protein M885DRAFT_569807 [Pelagophyceae sp. CCMP2097]|nr:hypothetical protein M885DRAFT_569807 [Pelagophyceae sp. CCMP2097]